MLKHTDKLLLVPLTAALVWLAWFSLRWRPELDSPLFLYMDFLLRHGYVPYRDFFDMNTPGTYALYRLLDGLSGGSDLGLRVVDLAWLAALLATTVGLLRPFGGKTGWCAAVLVGLSYLRLGPQFSLQREYLLLLPLALGLLLARQTQWQGWVRGFLGGLCVGLCATVKPPALVVLPVAAMLALWQEERTESARTQPWGVIAATVAGAAVFPALAMVYIVGSGGWPAFVDIARNYWPLYNHLDQYHRVLEGLPRLRYLAAEWTAYLEVWISWLPLPAIGAYLVTRAQPADGRRGLLLALWLLAGLAALYPLPAGQFWFYHWLPLIFALSLLSATAFVAPSRTVGRGLVPRRPSSATLSRRRGTSPRPTEEGGASRPALLSPLLTFCLLLWAITWYKPLQNNPHPMHGRPDAIASWLRAHAQPGDRVQPLDWTKGGVVQGMYLARVLPATRFLYAFHFYHHVSTPYIQGLRREFMSELQQARPRFIVQTTVDAPWPTGPDTTRDFPELAALLQRDYAPALVGSGFTIWERRGRPNPQAQALSPALADERSERGIRTAG